MQSSDQQSLVQAKILADVFLERFKKTHSLSQACSRLIDRYYGVKTVSNERIHYDEYDDSLKVEIDPMSYNALNSKLDDDLIITVHDAGTKMNGSDGDVMYFLKNMK